MKGPVVDAEWLVDHVHEEDLVVADCRWYLGQPGAGRRAYDEGHVPGAVFLSLDTDLRAVTGPGRHPLPRQLTFAQTLGRVGIGNRHIVIAYDDRGGAVAARLWWMLDRLGHERVSVLDGGLVAWTAAGGQLVTETPDPSPEAYTATDEPWPVTVSRSEIRLGARNSILVDARDAPRYRGDEEPVDPVAGHIPGAVNVPYTGNLDPNDRFLAPKLLAERFASVGITAGTDVTVYCGSGVTACHDILAMEIAGLGRPHLYPGSWSDWSASGEAVETG